MIIITQRAYKYRIYPTESQITNLLNQFSMCRYLYNWSLDERIKAYENEQRIVTYKEQQNRLPDLKEERPWFKGVYSQVLQDVLQRLDKAYQAFFRRVKEGDTPGFPKFKKKGEWDSITYPQYRHLPDNKIDVSKIGIIKMIYHRDIPEGAKIKTLTITKEADKWFACFSVELSIDIEPKQDLSSAIGIDLGLIDFLYPSDGSEPVKAPKYYRQLQDKLARLQRRFAKADKYSAKWYKLLKAIQKVYYRIRCLKHDFLHKTANELLKKADIIVHEDLNISGMIRRPKPKQDEDGKYLPNNATAKSGLNKSIADAAWGQFLNILKYKAIGLGKKVIGIPPQYTSQECPACHQIVKKSLSTRTHCCPCGFVANRDYAASLNILRIGLDTLTA